MRIVIHAGFHKSGTTTAQTAWHQWYGSPGACWYPPPGASGPGHAAAVLPHRTDPIAHAIAQIERSAGDASSLCRYVEQARIKGVETLVLSSEVFGQLNDDDWATLETTFDPADLTVLFTATRPVHRWFSIWQELVKHGLPARPAQAGSIVIRGAALGMGNLERVVRTPPAARVIVRLVQTNPPEADLARALARLLHLPVPVDTAVDVPPANVSIGAGAELLRDLNSRAETLGFLTPESEMRFEMALRTLSPTTEFAAAPEDFAVPPAVVAAAVEEQRFLRSLCHSRSDAVQLADPLGLLDDWTSSEEPPWLRDVVQRAWGPYNRSDIDGWAMNHATTRRLAAAQATASHLTEEVRAMTQELQAAALRLSEAEERNADLEARVHELAAAVDELTNSRSWRLTAPLRAAAAHSRSDAQA